MAAAIASWGARGRSEASPAGHTAERERRPCTAEAAAALGGGDGRPGRRRRGAEKRRRPDTTGAVGAAAPARPPRRHGGTGSREGAGRRAAAARAPRPLAPPLAAGARRGCGRPARHWAGPGPQCRLPLEALLRPASHSTHTDSIQHTHRHHTHAPLQHQMVAELLWSLNVIALSTCCLLMRLPCVQQSSLGAVVLLHSLPAALVSQEGA